MTDADQGNERDAFGAAGLCERLLALPVTIRRFVLSARSVVAGEWTVDRTFVRVVGDGSVGFGEDVTPDPTVHERVAEADAEFPTGHYTIETASRAIGETLSQLLTGDEADTAAYHRWALESAVLDLALKQAGESLGDHLGRPYEPVEFVASPKLGDPPGVQPLYDRREVVSDLEFKIDVPSELRGDVLEGLAAIDAIRILDFKGQYETDTDPTSDPALYSRLLEAFPDAILEDPVVTDGTVDVLEAHSDRIAWDAPITGVESVQNLEWEPQVLNVKPCRFGTLKSLCQFLEYAFEQGIDLYGGGMFEVSAGRAHSQAFASLFYPDGPNDLAPPAYHNFEPGDPLPSSPIEPPARPVGIGWYTNDSDR